MIVNFIQFYLNFRGFILTYFPSFPQLREARIHYYLLFFKNEIFRNKLMYNNTEVIKSKKNVKFIYLILRQIMEKENLPYRWLRNPKKKSFPLMRKSLLVPLRHKREDHNSHLNEKDSIMSQNVSQYLHMLSNCHIKENYIKWAINLRSSSPKVKNPISREGSTPGVFFKPTKASILRTQNTKSTDRHPFNSAEYSQYISKKEKCANFNESCLKYMVSLRDYEESQTKQKQKFCSLPKKERNQIPTFLKKDFIKKTRSIQKEDKQIALDGAHLYPNYTQNILRDKNYGLLCAFTNGKNKASLPNLAWQVGLRSY